MPRSVHSLHVACEVGNEQVARALIAAEPACAYASSAMLGGRSPLDICRENDLGSLARRLEAFAKESVVARS